MIFRSTLYSLIILFSSCYSTYADSKIDNAKIPYVVDFEETTLLGTKEIRSKLVKSEQTLKQILNNIYGEYIAIDIHAECVAKLPPASKKNAKNICYEHGYRIVAPLNFDRYENAADIRKFYSKCSVVINTGYNEKENTINISTTNGRLDDLVGYSSCQDVPNTSRDLASMQSRTLVHFKEHLNIPNITEYIKGTTPKNGISGSELFVLISSNYDTTYRKGVQSGNLKTALPKTKQYICSSTYPNYNVGGCVLYEEWLEKRDALDDGNGQLGPRGFAPSGLK